MKIILLFILFFLAASAFSDTEICGRQKSGIYSVKGITVDTTIDIKYYGLELKITGNPNYLYGKTRITGALLNSRNSLFLNLSNNLNVDSVNGVNVTGYSHANNAINITFTGNITEFDINIFYRGLPPQTGFGSFVFSAQNNVPVIWSLSEPYGSSDWFPNKNAPSDKADSSDVRITCAQNLTGVSNGKLISEIINNDNTKTYHWKSSYPIASYLISIAVTNYALYKNYYRYSQNDSMDVTHYIYPTQLNQLKPSLDLTPRMIEIFSDRYSQYPFLTEKYGHAQFNWGGGMEHQTISSMGSFGWGIIAHELAHQWFGDKVTCRDFHHIWLNEGFATYSEAIYVEAKDGKESYDNYIALKMLDAKKAAGTVYVADDNNINEIFNGYRSYSKGAVIVHMLRGVTGDSVFFSILKNYLNDTALAYGTAVTEDFQRVAESDYGKSLNYFFQEWIYGENCPKYKIEWSYTQNPVSGNDVRVKITQSQNSNPSFFTMPADIKIKTNFGDTVLTVFNNSQVQEFVFNIYGTPSEITFDPDNKILKEKSGDEPVESIDFRLEQNYPNPFNPYTVIDYKIKSSENVTLKVYDVSGKEVQTLVNENQRPASYTVKFVPANIASGVYFYKLSAGGLSETRKMVYIK
ncbi:MAG: T9SS type A sorting domain-containing protein [Ignavibacteria bacterium]|jgi:aminopeptidase N|nr:T9SS type A sorting domain-containing protein [Ignavibacteria bacterium]